MQDTCIQDFHLHMRDRVLHAAPQLYPVVPKSLILLYTLYFQSMHRSITYHIIHLFIMFIVHALSPVHECRLMRVSWTISFTEVAPAPRTVGAW